MNLKLLWYIILGFIFLGSKIWGDTQDTIFWGVLLLIANSNIKIER